MASQNPLVSQVSEAPILHATYDSGASRGDLPDKYTDAVLFAQNMPAWQKQSALRYGQSDAYMQAVNGTQNQYHVAPIRA